ncbi:CRISPR-associated helicase, Cas3 family [Thermomonospora echinospora]|uniref:CRISPR-associated helicase, Cas3 family n=1 Tax=Thermomonospora echinospora TaxID=1992 RepID=A0A1H6AIE0_9ACTN|nr:CRISPR-associated helicase/endonuclease Cas3 [Thermomonospora echinospora]SEG48519.1 CRISPR-associated helicase, Cas3 family [Thermomonospora echinospora]
MGPLPHLRAKSAQGGRSAEELTDHLQAGLAAAQALRERVGRIEALTPVFGEDFWTAVLLGILCHDCGKACECFQDVVWGRSKSWGQRHEVVSLGWLPALIPDPDLRRWVAVAVATHHRPLSDERGRSLTALYGDVALEEFRTLVEPLPPADAQALAAWLATTAQGAGLPVASTLPMDVVAEAHHQLNEVLETWWPPVYEDSEGIGAVLLQGAVTLADHLSSAHGSLHSVQPLGPGFPALLERHFIRQGRELREHQKRAAEVNGHLLLRAPTGSGKTEAGLLWSSTQVARLMSAGRGVPRVFYTLPYLASINSMARRLGKLLGDNELIGVAHSRAASYHLTTAITPEDDEPDRADAAHKAVSRAKATRLFRETVRVGTPYQLMRGALAGPSHSSVLVDAANSVFVLDELHAYDPKRLGYLLATASFWDRLGGSVAVLSATLPQALAELLRETLGEDVPEISTPDLGLPQRHRLRIRSHHLTDPAAIAEIGERIRGGRSVLVVANNIKDAQHLFDELAPVAGDDSDAAVLLHSRFRRKDRLNIEERLRTRYGTGGDRRPGLVVATQVVEVSLDVDFDMLFTSAAPLEALLQRFGRVNRVGLLPPADVIVHTPTYAPRRKGQEDYADGVYPREPVEVGFDILLRHQGAVVDEAQATTWLNDVYATPWGGTWSTEVRECRKAFQDTFLTFGHPFHDRSDLAEAFDELFDGTEAILQSDLDAYREALSTADGAAGRLLAEDYLIPMPHWAAPLASWERELGIRIVDGDYDEDRGLLTVHGPVQASYQLGELI